jgi:hypothetical protein
MAVETGEGKVPKVLISLGTRVVVNCPTLRGSGRACKGCTLATYTVVICFFLSVGLMGSTIEFAVNCHSAQHEADVGWVFYPDPDDFIAIIAFAVFAGYVKSIGITHSA